MNTMRNLIKASAALAILAAANLTTQAAVPINASGTFTFVADPVTSGLFDYTITIFNNDTSGGPSIGSFWYAWTPTAGDFLPHEPATEAGPSGWTANPSGVSPSSVQFVKGSLGTAIAPGSSGVFTFSSTDTPAVLNGNTGGGTPIGSSFVYSGGIEVGNAGALTITEAPEPSALALFVLGGLGFAGLGRLRKWRTNAA
jgi:hypothetical protein